MQGWSMDCDASRLVNVRNSSHDSALTPKLRHRTLGNANWDSKPFVCSNGAFQDRGSP